MRSRALAVAVVLVVSLSLSAAVPPAAPLAPAAAAGTSELSFARLPAGADLRADSPAGLAAARERGVLTDLRSGGRLVEYGAPYVARNETLVVRLSATGLGEAVDAFEGTPRQRLRQFFRETDARLRAVQPNPGPERPPVALGLFARPSTGVVADPANDTYVLLVDTARAPLTYDWNDNGRADDADRAGVPTGPDRSRVDDLLLNVSATFGDALDAPATSRDVTVASPTVAFASPLDEGEPYVPPTADATLYGATTLAPGTEVRVTLTVWGTPRRATATVRPDGTLSTLVVRVDPRNAPRGQRLPLRARFAGGRVELVPDEARAVPLRARLSVPDQRAGEFVRVESVALSHGGLVVLYRGGRGGEPVGVGAVGVRDSGPLRIPVADLASTDPADVTSVAYRDVDGSGNLTTPDVPYRTDDRAVVSDGARIRTPTPTPTPEPTPTPTPTATPTPTPTATPAVLVPPEIDESTSLLPGFGPALAVFALLSLAAALARRR